MLNFGVMSLLALGFTFGISTQANATDENIENNCKMAFDATQEAFTHNRYGQKVEKQAFKATKYKVEGIYCKIFITNLLPIPVQVKGYLKIVDSDGVSEKKLMYTESSIDPEDTGVLSVFTSNLKKQIEKMIVVQDENSVINSFAYYGRIPKEHYKK